jgi:hypothetical protein
VQGALTWMSGLTTRRILLHTMQRRELQPTEKQKKIAKITSSMMLPANTNPNTAKNLKSEQRKTKAKQKQNKSKTKAK